MAVTKGDEKLQSERVFSEDSVDCEVSDIIEGYALQQHSTYLRRNNK
jgi:hypothetical protein